MTRSKIVFGLTLTFILVTIYGSLHHEIWRDEARALSVINASHSLTEFFSNLRTEGLPGLWHGLLALFYKGTGWAPVLKILSLVIGAAAAAVFLSASPFSWTEKILFLAGYFPLYEYTVIARPYGLSMLLLFMACAFYVQRWQRPWPFALSLFFLAQTNAHSLVITGAFFITLLAEIFFLPASERQKILTPGLKILTIIFLGLLWSFLQIYPSDPESIVKAELFRNPSQPFWHLAFSSVLFLGNSFAGVARLDPSVVHLFYWITLLVFFRVPAAAIFFFTATAGLNLFFNLIYPGMVRHQGLVYLVFIASLWMERQSKPLSSFQLGSWIEKIITALAPFRQAFFLVVLITQMVFGLISIRWDLDFPYSSSAAFAHLLRTQTEFKNAVLVPEPDYLIEALPYYVSNDIYLAREKRFKKYSHFTTANDPNLSLSELLSAAETVQKKTARPVLIVLGHPLNAQGPFQISHSYRKLFTYSPEELKMLEAKTDPLARFSGSASQEDYDIYRLKTP